MVPSGTEGLIQASGRSSATVGRRILGHDETESAYDRRVGGDDEEELSSWAPEGGLRAAEPAGSSQPVSSVSMAAADLRRALQLTPHQLGELTSRLRLEIGLRPNYPRYRRTEVHLLTAALTLREVRVPLEDACEAVVAFADYLLAGDGWLVMHPSGNSWAAFAARTLPAVGSLLTLATRASVVDVAAVRHRSDSTWSQLVSAADASPQTLM